MKTRLLTIFLIVLLPLFGFLPQIFADISLSSYDSTIGSTDRLLIMGTIEGNFQSFHPIKLIVYDPLGNIVYQPNVAIDAEGNFKYMITPPLSGFDDGIYTVDASQEDLEEKTQLQFTVSSDISVKEAIEEEESSSELWIMVVIFLIIAAIIIIALTKTSQKKNHSK